MVLSKLDLAIVAVVAAGILWIEHEHRIFIGTPAAAEVAGPAASACPETDSVPFSADCLAFIDRGPAPEVRARVGMAGTAGRSIAASRHAEQAGACPPSNENAPYSASCIRFLSGWYWQPNPMENAP
jgi:hypothetical protein